MLGLFYSKGCGVKEDKEKAIEYYKKAAEQGNEEAIAALGETYEEKMKEMKNNKTL